MRLRNLLVGAALGLTLMAPAARAVELHIVHGAVGKDQEVLRIEACARKSRPRIIDRQA